MRLPSQLGFYSALLNFQAGSCKVFFFFVFNLEAAQMCQREVTRQEVGAIECGCVGEVSLAEVDEERF